MNQKIPYTALAAPETVHKVKLALEAKGYSVSVVADRAAALRDITSRIPKGASVNNGSSVTLEQIGYQEYLKSGKHGWIDFHARIISENDAEKRRELRKQSSYADFYLGSVHALVEDGDFIIASNTGSQLPSAAYTSPNLIFVVGAQKIVPTLAEGLKRLTEYVVPLEDKHMRDLYGMGTHVNKILIFKGEASVNKRSVHCILVNEVIGF